jgi:predicted Fe-Mo cluster-binding NifX family protein
MEFEAVPNPAMSQGGGAGIQAAQFVVNRGARAVLTGNLGPNAYDVLQAAGVPAYPVVEGTVRQAVEAYRAGSLQAMGTANVTAHAGMRGGGRGAGRGMGWASGMRPAAAAPAIAQAARESELSELRETLKSLRQKLAETMDKIEKLEREG